jgi:hypothetical protein
MRSECLATGRFAPCRVLAHLSVANYYSPELREPLSQQAVDMARRLGDPKAQMVALWVGIPHSQRRLIFVRSSRLRPRFLTSLSDSAIRSEFLGLIIFA